MNSNLKSPDNGTTRRRDVRQRALLIVLFAVLLVGFAIRLWPERVGKEPLSSTVISHPASAAEPFAALRAESPTALERRALAEEEGADRSSKEKPKKIAGPLDDAAKLIKKKKYNAAISLLDSQRDALNKRPEAFVLLGRALEGRGDAATARDFYAKALAMDPFQSEAYWGYATASERLGDLESAMGAMRSFLHTDPDPDPNRLRISQARSALWEWEAQLGRGPWGASKGIMPGLTPEQQRKDKTGGVAIMMPLPGTEQEDGATKFVIKHQSKFKLFERD